VTIGTLVKVDEDTKS